MATVASMLPALRVATARSCVLRTPIRRTFVTRSCLLAKRYTKNHEWIELDESGKIGTIGISEYAAKALGDVVYVELPETDLEVEQGDSVGAVESVKSASDIYSPVAGKVVETNSVLEEKPGTINKSPEADGWLAKLEVKDAAEIDALMSKEDYDAFEKDDDH